MRSQDGKGSARSWSENYPSVTQVIPQHVFVFPGSFQDCASFAVHDGFKICSADFDATKIVFSGLAGGGLGQFVPSPVVDDVGGYPGFDNLLGEVEDVWGERNILIVKLLIGKVLSNMDGMILAQCDFD
ncbi:hypothetical protein [Neolewinella lacunae]|uniref:hypothetical protein n=1 Tax=Neolewinella lacunae TaxID=1517758 RepID=UPI001CA46DA9|nr:hypothetical protein [Neolewinella lacunae]